MSTTAPPQAKSSKPSAASARGRWHRSAPSDVRQVWREGNDTHGWAAWTEYLAGRRRPLGLKKLLPGDSPLGWALPDEAEARGTLDLLARLDRFGSKRFAESDVRKTAAEWLSGPASPLPDTCWAVEALAWCSGLPRLAAKLDADLWWAMVDHLLDAVAAAGGLERDRHPVVHQQIAGELAVTLGYLLPKIAPCRKAARGGRRALSAGLVELTDGRGFVHGSHLDLLRPLLATWTRCRAIGEAWPAGRWNGAAEIQYEWLLRHAIRLTRHDGSHALSRGSAAARSDGLLRAALELAGNPQDWAIASTALPGVKKKEAKKAKAGEAKPPSAAYDSPWGEAAVLRSGWSRADARLVAAYDGGRVRLEFETAKKVLLSGPWSLDVRRDGRRLDPTSEWDEVCWLSDKDIDYLEVEIELTEGVRVERHMALAREDRFLFLADAVLGTQPAELEYRGRIPMADGVTLDLADQTREGYLAAKKPAALVLPLALPEWRIDDRVGSLAADDGSIELRQSARGTSLFAPLFIDLAPGRIRRPFTWRQLTVGESLEIQPPDVAVGYRVEAGGRQWLFYRTLAPKGNRTLLGHNLASDLLIARFRRDGEVESLIEIE